MKKPSVSRTLSGNPLFNVIADMGETERIDTYGMTSLGFDSVPGKINRHFIIAQKNSTLPFEIAYNELFLSEE